MAQATEGRTLDGHDSRKRKLRFWLPTAQPLSLVAIDFEPHAGLFSLLCLRRAREGFALMVARPNHFRLRELEAILVELEIALPETLRRYFVAALAGDDVSLAELAPRAAECCLHPDSVPRWSRPPASRAAASA